jgi:hypothetical protein
VEGAELKPDNWLSDLRALMADKIEWQQMLTATLRERISKYLEAEGTVSPTRALTLVASPAETIYFAIPAFRDLWCGRTLDTIFRYAKRPENVRVGLFLQVDQESERVLATTCFADTS